jgi:hypothetical protein
MADTIIETLEFKTQIHTSWDGNEQRMALRNYPRRAVAYDYQGMTPAQSQYLRALTYAKQTEKIEIPLWHAGCPLNENAYTNFAKLKVGITDLWQFRGCEGVLFWKGDEAGGDRYFLETINADGYLKLSELLEKDYSMSGTVVYPVSYGSLKSEDDYTIQTSCYASMSLNFDLMPDYPIYPMPTTLNEDNFEPWEITTPYQIAIPSVYLGVPIFPIMPTWDDDITAKFTRNANKLDNDSGILEYDLKSLYSSETKDLDYILSSKSEINNFQRFFTHCKGMLKSFYAPTWLDDMTLTESAPIGQSYLMVSWPMFYKYYASMTRRKTIIVFMKSGNIKILPVAGYSTDTTGNFGKVYLDSPLTTNLLFKDIAMISFFCRYRFGSDILTTNYETTEIAKVTVPLVEVNV